MENNPAERPLSGLWTDRLADNLAHITLGYSGKIWQSLGAKNIAPIASGDPGVIRTRGLRFRKPSLYPAELRGHWLKRLVKRFAKRVNLRQCTMALP